MIEYPLPPGLIREQFHSLVTNLYYQLTAKGIDTSANIVLEDIDDVVDDEIKRPHFALFISEAAAPLLKEKPKPRSVGPFTDKKCDS